jgi:hypothetical protein
MLILIRLCCNRHNNVAKLNILIDSNVSSLRLDLQQPNRYKENHTQMHLNS